MDSAAGTLVDGGNVSLLAEAAPLAVEGGRAPCGRPKSLQPSMLGSVDLAMAPTTLAERRLTPALANAPIRGACSKTKPAACSPALADKVPARDTTHACDGHPAS